MIIAAIFLTSLLITLVLFGLQDCKGPISRYLNDRFAEPQKPNPFIDEEFVAVRGNAGLHNKQLAIV